MIAIILAATLYATTEKDGWTTSSIASVDSARDTSALFSTDGIVVVMTNWADAGRRVSFKVAAKSYSLALKPHSFNTVTL